MEDAADQGAFKTKGTSTSSFGVSGRESHDASDFYRRFPRLIENKSGVPQQPNVIDELFAGDSRDMALVNDNCVALVVTSPPYFAAKDYEIDLSRDGVPTSYIEYLLMLRDVFSECHRVLEPGGRIAINVANLGRRPFRSLASDIIHILQNELGFLLRGELIWLKAEGASGSCAWGSFQSASNPVLRDTTERIVVASKDRMDRALTRTQRKEEGLPFEDSITKEEFLEATLDVWRIRPESARRVGHPAPFPVDIPRRLIELFTYKGDLVLDPFMGAGSTALAARRTQRHFLGFDLDPEYVELARRRLRDDVP